MWSNKRANIHNGSKCKLKFGESFLERIWRILCAFPGISETEGIHLYIYYFPSGFRSLPQFSESVFQRTYVLLKNFCIYIFVKKKKTVKMASVYGSSIFSLRYSSYYIFWPRHNHEIIVKTSSVIYFRRFGLYSAREVFLFDVINFMFCFCTNRKWSLQWMKLYF